MNFKILRDKNFALLMFGKITSLIGSSMQSFALSLFVLATTGSATKFASILAVALIPQLILGPLAGVFVDWFDRKKIIIGLDLLSGAIVSLLAIVYIITGELPIGYIYILVISLSVISTLFQPTIQTVIPTICKKEELAEANSLNSFVLSLGNIIAPIVGGVVYGLFGLKIIFLINVISFFISALSECFLSIPKTNLKPEETSLKAFKRDFIQGIKFTIGRKSVLSLSILAMIINFSMGAFTVGGTYVCKIVLNVSDFQYGLTESTMVIAMLVSTFFIGYLNRKFSVGKNLYLSLLFAGLITSLFALVTFKPFINAFNTTLVPFMIMIVITFILCLFIGIANIFLGIYFQEVVPLDYMGRVSTVMGTLSMAAMPLSNMIFGVLFDKISATIIFLLSAVIVVIPVIIFKTALLSVNVDDKENDVGFKSLI